MQQHIYYPSKSLAPFISHYTFLQSEQKAKINLSYQDFPRTAMDMVFIFRGKIQIQQAQGAGFSIKNCEFIGLFDTSYQVNVDTDISALHIRFKPNGVYPLTRIPLHQITNGHLSLADLIGIDIKELHEQMAECSTHLEQINLLEAWLLPYYQTEQLHYRMEHGLFLIEQNNGLIKVKALSEKLNTNYKS